MIAIGLLTLWVSYVLTIYGYTKVHQMPVSIQDLVIPGRYDACKWGSDLKQGEANKASGCINSSSASSGTDTSAFTNTGTGKGTAQGAVQIATSQIGQPPGGASGYCQQYGAWYGMNCVEWCAIFVSWVLAQDGALSAMGGKASYVPTMGAKFVSMGIWHTGISGAQPGDIMIFSHSGANSSGDGYHTAIVSVAESGGVCTTIAGDTGNNNVAVEKWSSGSVAGYGRPRYPGTPSSTTPPTVVAA